MGHIQGCDSSDRELSGTSLQGCLRHLVRACGDRCFARFLRLKGTFGRAMPVKRLRACRLNRADAQRSDRGHRGCTRRCLRAGVCTSVLGSLTRPAAGALTTCPPPACRRWTVVTCSRAIYSAVAGAGVPRCARTGTGDKCGRAVLCAHGRAMTVKRLRVLRQMPHPVPAV